MKPQSASQPFTFSDAHEAEIGQILKHYPAEHSQSAILPILDLAQRQGGGWLSREAIEHVAQRLNMPAIRVYEVASFYSMFYLKPVGRYVIQLCRTTPCWLRGSDDLLQTCKDVLGIQVGETTPDNLFTLTEVECLGACTQGPVVQINDTYHENISPKQLKALLKHLKDGGSMEDSPTVHTTTCSTCACAQRGTSC